MRESISQLLIILQFEYTTEEMTANSPQMNEVAQGASVAEGLSVVLIVGVSADGNRESSLS